MYVRILPDKMKHDKTNPNRRRKAKAKQTDILIITPADEPMSRPIRPSIHASVDWLLAERERASRFMVTPHYVTPELTYLPTYRLSDIVMTDTNTTNSNAGYWMAARPACLHFLVPRLG